MPLLFIHTFRVVALGLFVPILVKPPFPENLVAIIAYGDFISAVLALVALFAALGQARFLVPLAWLFNVFGSIDVVNAMVRGAAGEMYQFDLGPQWYIPTFYAPLLIVTHVMVFILLLRKKGTGSNRADYPG